MTSKLGMDEFMKRQVTVMIKTNYGIAIPKYASDKLTIDQLQRITQILAEGKSSSGRRREER